MVANNEDNGKATADGYVDNGLVLALVLPLLAPLLLVLLGAPLWSGIVFALFLAAGAVAYLARQYRWSIGSSTYKVTGGQVWPAIVGLLVAIPLGLWLSNLGTRQPAPAADRAHEFAPGAVGTLRADGASNAPVARTQEAYKRLRQLMSAKDEAGLEQLVLSGQIMLVKVGTPVRVISTGWGIQEIRILEGPHKDRSGWVESGQVNKR